MSELLCRPLLRWQPQRPIRRRNRQEEKPKATYHRSPNHSSGMWPKDCAVYGPAAALLPAWLLDRTACSSLPSSSPSESNNAAKSVMEVGGGLTSSGRLPSVPAGVGTAWVTPWSCKGNPLRFRLPLVFRFRFRLRSVLRFRSRHLVSLPQPLRSNDILCHPLPTRFRSRSHDVA